uniref:Hyaluronan and proteoglycan link protein 1 n=1 Tax=Cyclopterus lumpus TaxID=8103 RepID=A0A8C2WDV8_CYCLU
SIKTGIRSTFTCAYDQISAELRNSHEPPLLDLEIYIYISIYYHLSVLSVNTRIQINRPSLSRSRWTCSSPWITTNGVTAASTDASHLQGSSPMDASLVITEITLEDYGRYKCEVIDGLEDGTVHSARPPPPRPPLLSPGVVFPYFPRLGRYTSTSTTPSGRAETRTPPWPPSTSCTRRGRGKLDWCNAGWLSDGSVQYPITTPREPCGGKNTRRNHYDVYCSLPTTKVEECLTYDEAVRACQQDGAQIAKVGQMYAAWKLLGYDRCDAGWLADGSVRYPVSRPRRRCSPTEAAVRFSGFPDKKHKLYGAYCFKGHN